MTTPTLTYREAALRVLKERGPMHYQDLAEAEAKVGKADNGGIPPATSMNH